jgi:hypothetical protein
MRWSCTTKPGARTGTRPVESEVDAFSRGAGAHGVVLDSLPLQLGKSLLRATKHAARLIGECENRDSPSRGND